MKLILSGVGSMAALVWYLSGGAGGPDADREIAKPPASVYAELSPLFPGGTTSFGGLGRDGVQREVVVEVKKSPERSIDYRMSLDGLVVMTMNLRLEAAGNGAATKLAGDLDVDQALVRFAASQNGGEARHLPEFAVNIAMDQMVDRMGEAIEQGQPLDKSMLFPLMRLSS